MRMERYDRNIGMEYKVGKENIAVSVICVTYNHEKYIREALDSILMQKTDFTYEILIGEDCSTDGTRGILKEYEKRYPGRFKMYYRDKNLGATKNEYELFMDARGRYIAALELDDIWTDPLKLQKQYDFLETHEEYIGVAHDFDIIDKMGQKIENSDNQKIKEYFNRSFTLDDFLRNGFIFQTGTHFYRNIFQDGSDYSIIYTADRLIRDKTILSLLLFRGEFYILPDTMSAYRRFFDADAQNGRNLTNSNLELDLFTKAHHVEMLNRYFQGQIDYSLQWSEIIYSYIKNYFKTGSPYTLKKIIYLYRHADKKTQRTIRQEFLKSVQRKVGK